MIDRSHCRMLDLSMCMMDLVSEIEPIEQMLLKKVSDCLMTLMFK